MNNKILSAPKNLTGDFTALYREIQTEYAFTKNTIKYCPINPYIVVTDSTDLILFKTGEEVDIGFWLTLPKPKKYFWFHNWFKINNMIQGSIIDVFFSLFNKIDLEPKEIKVIDSLRCIYWTNHERIYIPYFIILPFNKTLHMIPKSNVEMTTMSIKDFIDNNKIEPNQSIGMSHIIASMMVLGDINLPINT